MNLHDDMVAAAVLPVHKEVHGGTAFLHGAVSDALEITLVHKGPIHGRDDESGDEWHGERWREIGIAVADVANLEEWTEIDIDGERWRMTWPPERMDANAAIFRVTAGGTAAVQRPGYRG